MGGVFAFVLIVILLDLFNKMYRSKEIGDKMKINVGLAGNPNSGKTTLFNILTGSNQYVGNWAGVTVERKEGVLKNHNNVIITDLPGIYSLSPYTSEEVITRSYLVDNSPNVVINIIDGTNLQRNLYLTLQLIEIGVPMVVAINMIDVVRKNGGQINLSKLSEFLGVKVVEISALKNQGVENLINVALDLAKNKSDHFQVHKFNSNIENTLSVITKNALNKVNEKKKRYFAVKIFERDKSILKSLNLNSSALNKINMAITYCEKIYNDESVSLIISERYRLVDVIFRNCYSIINKGCKSSNKIDNILLGKYTAIPIFVLVIFLLYYISITLVGSLTSDFLTTDIFENGIITSVENFLFNIGCSKVLSSLICDGILKGVGSVIAFVPQLSVLFFFLGILEDTGYMSRIAFIMDTIFRKFGLSGKSIIPLLISSGCGVPGILSTKTIENYNQKVATIITTTFVPCSAKLQIIALISGTVFCGSWWVAPLVYFIGIFSVLVSSIILKNLNIINTDETPFVMEIPKYHLPSIKNLISHLWNRIKVFMIKAGTVLVIACIVIWFLSNYGIVSGEIVYLDNQNEKYSLVCVLSTIISKVFVPLGFGNWQSVGATFSGFFAKENIVASLSVFLGDCNIKSVLPNYSSALSFLVFNLLNSPCISAIITMAKELNSKKLFVFALLYQNLFAYLISLMIYQLVGFFIGEINLNIFTIIAVIVFALLSYLVIKKSPSNQKG